VSDSCNQAAENNVNNGMPRTRGTLGNPSTGVLLVSKSCVVSGGGPCTGTPSFNVQVTGSNPRPSSFSLSNGGSQSVTLDSGSFSVVESPKPGVTTSFSGGCMQTAPGSGEASGLIAAGQQITCTITNTAAPTTGTLDITEVCSDFSNGSSCRMNEFDIIVTGNNPQPQNIGIFGSGSRSVTLGPGSFTITELLTPGFLPGSFSDDCTGTISAGQHLTCTVLNEQL
jgi:hypothetical protein